MNKQEAFEALDILRIIDAPGLSEAVDMAKAALRAQEEAERNEPLTLEELLEMDGEPVWVVVKNAYESFTMCALVKVAEEGIWLTNNLGGRSECRFGDPFEDGITIYRYKPKET